MYKQVTELMLSQAFVIGPVIAGDQVTTSSESSFNAFHYVEYDDASYVEYDDAYVE